MKNTQILLNNNTTPTPGKLPNIWIITKSFMETTSELKYCVSYQEFYLYKNNYWQSIKDTQFNRLFINWLKKNYVNLYQTFEPKRLKDVKELFSSQSDFSLVESKKQINSIVLPFKNGVYLIGPETENFIPHDPALYNTHIINVVYREDQPFIGSNLHTFISDFCDNHQIKINVLQAILYTIITNTTKYQLIYYLYGPGGTGKSTLTNILIYLLGNSASMVTTLSALNNRFESYNLINKVFVLLNDISHYKGKEPAALKLLSSSDPKRAEIKYGQPINITTNLILAITANTLWEINNPTSGLIRRMLYFPVFNIPGKKNMNLFNINTLGEAYGELVQDLPAFVQWILKADHSVLEQAGDKLTELDNEDQFLLEINPMVTWINETLDICPTSKEPVGNQKSNTETLYGHYYAWCLQNNIEPIKINRFSESLIDKLRTSLKISDAKKKRSASGNFITGIKFKNKNLEEKTSKNKEIQTIEQKSTTPSLNI